MPQSGRLGYLIESTAANTKFKAGLLFYTILGQYDTGTSSVSKNLIPIPV